VVLEGTVTGMYKENEVTLERAQWLEDGGLLESDSGSKAKSEISSKRIPDQKDSTPPRASKLERMALAWAF